MEIISPKQILQNLAEKLAPSSSADDQQAGVAQVDVLKFEKYGELYAALLEIFGIMEPRNVALCGKFIRNQAA